MKRNGDAAELARRVTSLERANTENLDRWSKNQEIMLGMLRAIKAQGEDIKEQGAEIKAMAHRLDQYIRRNEERWQKNEARWQKNEARWLKCDERLEVAIRNLHRLMEK